MAASSVQQPAVTQLDSQELSEAEEEPAMKKLKLTDQPPPPKCRVKWLGDLPFVQRMPDRFIFCGYSKMVVTPETRVFCFACQEKCSPMWICYCPCHELQEHYDERLRKATEAQRKKDGWPAKWSKKELEAKKSQKNPWIHMKTHEDPWKPMKAHEGPWRPMKTHEDPWRPMNSHENLWKYVFLPKKQNIVIFYKKIK